jgi:hypothetical protein
VWPTSPAFNVALLESSRTWATKIEILYSDTVVTSLDVLISGYIGIDDVAVRRESHFTISDQDGALTPRQATDLLTPKGTEMRISRGLYVRGENGLSAYEYVPMGVFGIVEPEIRSHSDGVVIEIKGFDRVDKLRALRFEDPWVVADGTPIHTAIAAIIADRMPEVAIRVTTSDFITPEVVFDRLSSPWDAIKALAESSAYVAYFDQLGQAVVEPITEIESGVTYTIGEKSVLMNVSRKFLDTENTYSGVIVRGQHPDYLPISFELWDDDPTSPTYSSGPFGRRPYGVWSDLITGPEQAEAVAIDTLPRVTRMKQEVQITTRGHPGHEIYDVITVVDPRSGTDGKFTLISGTIPLVNQQGEHTRLRCREAVTL